MAERIYVALDLETTGLDANRDAIIEIGAVRFQGDYLYERFSTLVNPQQPIPLRIQQMTGIRTSDVVAAPPLAQVAPELLAFVGSDVTAIVAHNAGFDLGFLRAAGLNLHRPALDTFELATILLPMRASYNLGELCRYLDIPLAGAHRAAADAEATARLFAHLCHRLHELPLATLELIVASGQQSEWPFRFLFEEALASAHTSRTGAPRVAPGQLELRPAGAPALAPTLPAAETIQAIPPEQVEAFLSGAGPLALQMGDAFERRPGQERMARQVTQALNQGDHLLVEAGTGTGKTLAYLLPAALWSVANGQRVLIATNTIALQDQLLHKDIPQVQALLADAGRVRPLMALLKGRTNYLCTRRLHAWRTGRSLTPSEVSLLAKILVWLTVTATGDVSELLLVTPAERESWLQLCSETTCSPVRCGGMGHDERGLPTGDFFLEARRQAEAAHLLVVNHALLLADLAAGHQLLPPYTHLIVDEAHHLEEVATEQLTVRIDWRWLLALVHRLAATQLLGGALAGAAWRHQRSAVTTRIQEVAERAADLRRALNEFGLYLRTALDRVDRPRQQTGYAQRLALDSRLRSQPLWSEVEVAWDPVSTALRAFVSQVEALAGLLDEAQWWESEPTASLYQEVRTLAGELGALALQLDTILFEPHGSDGLVKWAELSDANEYVSLAAAPIHVNTVIAEGLVQHCRSAIFTSATLQTGAGFDFMRERLGLWEVETLAVESPFDYESNALLLLPTDVPAPNQPHYQQAVEQAVIAAATAAQGRTLVLFTSHAQLRTTAEAIRAPLDELNITVLQHGAGSRTRLLREYRAADRAVLLGTRSFWEGIDLPGDELTCLLIARLPFAVPDDPLVAARSDALDDAFHDYTLPDAVLRFRQGFGRLIRRASDRGVIGVLDSRIGQRSYGRAFLAALPRCTVRRIPLAQLGGEVSTWLC
jgi:ATP-dependent DNA helicase DinG